MLVSVRTDSEVAMSEQTGVDIDVPVLVVGGSMIGLATSMFLAQHGVDVLSIEKHHGTAIHPRAGYFQLRTNELMRVAGIEDRVSAASLALYEPDGGMNNVESLYGPRDRQLHPQHQRRGRGVQPGAAG